MLVTLSKGTPQPVESDVLNRPNADVESQKTIVLTSTSHYGCCNSQTSGFGDISLFLCLAFVAISLSLLSLSTVIY